MYIYRQTQRCPYTGVSVLLLRWEDDASVDQGTASLESVFRDTYHYDTTRWSIPITANASIKLGVEMASFLEKARPDHLLIIYYAGHGFVGGDNQLYWAKRVNPQSGTTPEKQTLTISAVTPETMLASSNGTA
jgi:hypothetical protein